MSSSYLDRLPQLDLLESDVLGGPRSRLKVLGSSTVIIYERHKYKLSVLLNLITSVCTYAADKNEDCSLLIETESP